MQQRGPRSVHPQDLRLRQAGDPPPPPSPLRAVERVGDRRGVQGSLPGLHPRRRRPPISPLRRRFAQVLPLRLQLAPPARRVPAPLLARRLRRDAQRLQECQPRHRLRPHVREAHGGLHTREPPPRRRQLLHGAQVRRRDRARVLGPNGVVHAEADAGEEDSGDSVLHREEGEQGVR